MMLPSHPRNEGNEQIELPDVGSIQNASIANPSGPTESSMEIEQSVPTVAEIRGKSDREELVAPSRRRKVILYTALVAPFFLLAVILIIVFSVTSGNDNKSAADDLRNMDPSDGYTAVVTYLTNHGISDYAELIQEGSYQNMAAKWMAHDDPHSMKIPKASPASKEGYSFIQRYIMVLMYYQMGGESWKFSLNFLVAEKTCSWNSWIVKLKTSVPMGVRCNKNGLIEEIVMIGTKMQGKFPTEIGKLTTLRVLEMDVNEIAGSIPDEFHKLDALANLHLSHNKLTGTLASYLGNFPDLTSIDVSFNMMEGTLPAEMATSMQKLRGVAVDNNLFTGRVCFWESSLARATAGMKQENLEYIFLEKNLFEGIVEESMALTLPSLKALDISDNGFKGPLSPTIFHLANLQVLDLHGNSFTGPIPHGIPANTALKFLSLHKNEFSGKITETIGNIQLLSHLDLSNNKFTGIKSNTVTGFGLGSLKELTYLFLSANEFPAGPIPEWIQNMSKLEELSLKSLKMDGPIPSWIGELSNLVLLDLDDNELRGTIPTEFGTLSKLQFLLLNRNELTEEVPAALGSLSSLRLLYLDTNALVGDLSMVCDRPSPLPSIVAADCGGTDPEIVCDCCQMCCKDGDKCNDDVLVPSNDPLWQFSYDRLFYSFGNFTGYFVAVPSD